MIDKKTIKKILSDITKNKQGLKSHDIMHPEREWFIGLATAVALLGMSAAWSINQYQAYSDSDYLRNVSPTETNAFIYREHEVSAALESLTERERQYSVMRDFLVSRPTPLDTTSDTEAEPETELATTTPLIAPDQETTLEQSAAAPEVLEVTPAPL